MVSPRRPLRSPKRLVLLPCPTAWRSPKRLSFSFLELRHRLPSLALWILVCIAVSVIHRSHHGIFYYYKIPSGNTDSDSDNAPTFGGNVTIVSNVEATSLPTQPECDLQYDHPTIHKRMHKQWNYIDATLQEKYNNSRVSGGIFLYPRQVSILSDVICRIQQELRKVQKGMTICETGFGSGHSMAMFQSIAWACGNDFTIFPSTDEDNTTSSTHQSRQEFPVHVVSFDKFDRPYQRPIWRYLNRNGALRSSQSIQNQFIPGDSCQTVPSHLTSTVQLSNGPSLQCDILHGSSLCKTDNVDLVEHSPCGVLLTSTAMSKLTDSSVYFGPQAQWRKLRERGCITDIVCFQEDINQLDTLTQDFVFAKKGSNYTGAFCMAVSTGKCQKDKQQQTTDDWCDTDMHRILTKMGLNTLCPVFQIPVPS